MPATATADALLRRSADDGARWGPVRRLNDDPVGNGRTQYLPRLSMAPDGRLDAMFYDRRDDDEDVLNNVSYTYSHRWRAVLHRQPPAHP